MHSLQLESGDVEQVHNPWSARSNDQDPSSAGNHQRGSTDSVFRDDALVSPQFTTRLDRDMIISPSPPPPSAEPTHAQSPMEGTDTTPTDPRIASLKAIFPDFDDAVILSVLESTNNDHDRALDVLLGMNDPSFLPPVPPPSQLPNQFQSAPSSDAQRHSQEALDEQLARRLALEEQQTATQAWPPEAAEGPMMYQAYQPRRGGRNGSGGQPQTQGQGGSYGVAEFQEGFNRIAESGKKTFSSIVSKMKAKMQEFEQGQGWSGSQTPPPNQPPRPASASYYPSYVPGQQQNSGQGAYAQPYQSTQPANPQTQTSLSWPVRAGTYPSSPPRLRPAATEPAQSATSQQPSYYDPNARGYDLYGDDEDIQIVDNTTPSAAAAASVTTTQSPATPPHADSPATPPPPSDTSTPPSYASPVSSPPFNSTLSSPPARSFSPTTAGARSTTPGAPGGVDFSKLGLLPKRPISLVRPQSPPVAGAGASVGAPRVAVAHSESTTGSETDREEEPEYVENPFEDT